jgi:DNA-binding transcriptional LysR family regulator
MSFDLRQLRALNAISKYGGFSSAAREINLTQPTLSTHIRNLEAQLGVRLFDRLGRNVILTPAGKVFADYARRITDLCDQSVQAVQAFLGEMKGEVILEASTVPGEYLLPRWLGSFTKMYPEIKITLTISDSTTVKERVSLGEIPMGVTGSPAGHPLQTHLLCEDEIILVAPGELVQSSKSGTELDTADLSALPIIRREPGSGTQETVEKALKESGMDPDELNWIATFGSTQAIIEGVMAGLGSSFLSKRTVEKRLSSGELVRMNVMGLRIKRGFYIITHSARSISPITQELLNYLLVAGKD